mgnify:CR=1 FL=1
MIVQQGSESNMYRLAICEDESNIRSMLVRLCKEILDECSVEHTITEFSSAEAFEAAVQAEDCQFDVLLLDIKLEEKTGMDLALELRDRDDRISIIFITGYEEYLREGYSVQPIQYLLKPIEKNALAKALNTDIKLNYNAKTVVLRKGIKTTAITLKDVLYIESLNHIVMIHLVNSEISFPQTLTETMQMLPDNVFCQIHKSYLVNMEHIVELSRSEAMLSNSARLPVGRKYYQEAQRKFIRYINL